VVKLSASTLAVLIQGFVVLLSPSRQIPGETQIVSSLLPSMSFTIHYLLIILLFNSGYYELLTVSLNNPEINNNNNNNGDD